MANNIQIRDVAIKAKLPHSIKNKTAIISMIILL